MPSRDWAGFLSSHFRRLDGIKQYHHFRCERDHPGVVFLKKTATAEEEQRCLLRGVWLPSPVEKPPSITPAGLSLERLKYLYNKIREYCREMCKTSCVRIQTFLFIGDLTQDQSRHLQSVHGSDSTLYLFFFNRLFSKPPPFYRCSFPCCVCVCVCVCVVCTVCVGSDGGVCVCVCVCVCVWFVTVCVGSDVVVCVCVCVVCHCMCW